MHGGRCAAGYSPSEPQAPVKRIVQCILIARKTREEEQ